MTKQPVGPLQRELRLEPSNPIAGPYLAAIDAAIAEADDGVPKAHLRKQVPNWFLLAAASQPLYDRRKEARTDTNGRLTPTMDMATPMTGAGRN